MTGAGGDAHGALRGHLARGSYRGRCDEEGVGGLLERPASGSAKLEDRHALMGTVMRLALRSDLRHTGVFDADLFAK